MDQRIERFVNLGKGTCKSDVIRKLLIIGLTQWDLEEEEEIQVTKAVIELRAKETLLKELEKGDIFCP